MPFRAAALSPMPNINCTQSTAAPEANVPPFSASSTLTVSPAFRLSFAAVSAAIKSCWVTPMPLTFVPLKKRPRACVSSVDVPAPPIEAMLPGR